LTSVVPLRGSGLRRIDGRAHPGARGDGPRAGPLSGQSLQDRRNRQEGNTPLPPPCLSTPFPGPSASPPPLLFLFGPYSRHPRRTTRSVDAHVRAARTWVRAALPHASSRVTRAQSRRGRKAPLFEQPARRAYVFCPRRAPRCAPRVRARGRSREATQSRGGTGDAAPPSPPAWTSSFLAFCVCPCPGRHHSRDDVPQPVAPDRRRAVSQASRGDVRTCQV